MAWASQHKHRRSCFSRIASSFWHLGPWQSFDFQMKIVVLVRKVGSWKCGIWASVESTKLSHLSKSVWHTARKPSSKQEPAHWEWRAWHKEFTIWSFWLLFLKSKPSMESKKYYYQIYIYIYRMFTKNLTVTKKIAHKSSLAALLPRMMESSSHVHTRCNWVNSRCIGSIWNASSTINESRATDQAQSSNVKEVNTKKTRKSTERKDIQIWRSMQEL